MDGTEAWVNGMVSGGKQLPEEPGVDGVERGGKSQFEELTVDAG